MRRKYPSAHLGSAFRGWLALNIAKVAAIVFGLLTIGLIVLGFVMVAPAQRFQFMGWAELALGGLFVSLGIDRRQSGNAGGPLYIGVGVFLVVVVLLGTLLAPTHAH